MFGSEGAKTVLCYLVKDCNIYVYILLCCIFIVSFDSYAMTTSQKDISAFDLYIQSLHDTRKGFMKIEKYAKEKYKKVQLGKDKWKAIELDARKKRHIIEDKISHLLSHVINHRIMRIGKENLVLQRLDDQRESLSSFQGKIVVLNMWATWCIPCVREFESFKKIYRELRSRNFEILAVSHDDSKERIRAFLQGKGIEFPIYFDPNRQIYRKLVDASGLPILPFSILMDETGKVFKAYVGEQKWDSKDTLEEIEIILPQ